MNNETLNTVAAIAKQKAAGSPRWERAIARAVEGLQSGDICVTLFCDDYALVTTPTGQHMVNGVCDCTAAQHGHKECVHRCAKRLVELAETSVSIDTEVDLAADVASTPRKQLIVEIKACWPREWPPLAVELMRRFRVNCLEYLADDMLKAVRMAIAA
jgi:hypothetical protein